MTELTPQQQRLVEIYLDAEANLARANASLDRAVDHHERVYEIRRLALDDRIQAMRCCNAAGFSIHEHLRGQEP